VVRVGADGTEVGAITGLPFGGESVGTVDTRGDVASTAALTGAPTDAAVQLQHADVLVVGGIRHNVSGPRLWDCPHSLSGIPRRFYWVQAGALVDN